MDRERYEQIDRIFRSALERPDAERAAFVEEACGGDATLRREVESLISHDVSGELLGPPAFEDATRLLAAGGRKEPGPGDVFGQYKLVEQVGAGGMGVVYRALDTRLGRAVALKMLPVEYTRDADRLQRFGREARAASALNHPNILTVHEVGERDGAHYIATEYVEGETLRQRLARGPVASAEAARIAAQVADALEVAHERGIIHRDIKPENIMLRRRDQIVKVLDFGLAKLTEQARDDDAHPPTARPTETGVVMGTPRYMSPEQARGRQVDARSDVWSLGVVLYEMLAGAPPFEGETSQDVLASILKDEPRPLPADVPPELRAVVGRALRKDAGERYPSAASVLEDLRAALRTLEQHHGGVPAERGADADAASGARGAHPGATRPGLAGSTHAGAAALTDSGAHTRPNATGRVSPSATSAGRRRAAAVVAALLASAALAAAGLYYFRAPAPAGSVIDSLAVLPFENAGGDPEADYFSDGITESLINSLSELPNLKVMSRNSVFRYKGRPPGEALEAARQLGVRALLTGRVAQRGEQLFVSVELTDAADNTHVWGGQYDRRLADVFAVQQEIARDVARRLRLKLSGEEAAERAARRDADNFEAYQLYLRGRHEWYKFTPESIERSLDYFNRAVAADPSYALAYAGLANAYGLRAHLLGPQSGNYQRSKWAAEKAVELDPSLSEAHWALGTIRLFNEWDWAGAEASLKRALQLNPNSPEAHTIYGAYLEVMGRFEEAKAEIGRGLENDPLSLFAHAELAQAFYFAREYDEAIAQARKGLELGPHLLLYHVLARSLVQKGMYQEAIAEQKKAVELLGREPTVLATLGHAYAAAGQRAEALKVAAEMEGAAKQRFVSPYWIAVVYAGLDDHDRTFELLGRAADERFFMLIWLGLEPRFDRLRSDPRYPALARRIGLPER